MTTPRERALATAIVVPYEFQIILVIPKISLGGGGQRTSTAVGSHQKWAILNPSGHVPLLSGTARRKLRP